MQDKWVARSRNEYELSNDVTRVRGVMDWRELSLCGETRMNIEVSSKVKSQTLAESVADKIMSHESGWSRAIYHANFPSSLGSLEWAQRFNECLSSCYGYRVNEEVAAAWFACSLMAGYGKGFDDAAAPLASLQIQMSNQVERLRVMNLLAWSVAISLGVGLVVFLALPLL